MTLFAQAMPDEPIFKAAPDKYFTGIMDKGTLGKLKPEPLRSERHRRRASRSAKARLGRHLTGLAAG